MGEESFLKDHAATLSVPLTPKLCEALLLCNMCTAAEVFATSLIKTFGLFSKYFFLNISS